MEASGNCTSLGLLLSGMAFLGGATLIEVHDSESFMLSLLFWCLGAAGLLCCAIGVLMMVASRSGGTGSSQLAPHRGAPGDGAGSTR